MLERLSGRKATGIQRAYFMGSAGLFFLGKLSYLFFLVYGLEVTGPGSFLPNSMLFASGLLLLKGSHEIIGHARDYNG